MAGGAGSRRGQGAREEGLSRRLLAGFYAVPLCAMWTLMGFRFAGETRRDRSREVVRRGISPTPDMGLRHGMIGAVAPLGRSLVSSSRWRGRADVGDG